MPDVGLSSEKGRDLATLAEKATEGGKRNPPYSRRPGLELAPISPQDKATTIELILFHLTN